MSRPAAHVTEQRPGTLTRESLIAIWPHRTSSLMSAAFFAPSNLGEGRHVGADDSFQGSRPIEQARRDRGTNAWKSLEHKQSPRGASLRLPIRSAKNGLMRS